MANFDYDRIQHLSEFASSLSGGMTYIGTLNARAQQAIQGGRAVYQSSIRAGIKPKDTRGWFRKKERELDKLLDDRTFGEKVLGVLKAINPVRIFSKIFGRDKAKEDDWAEFGL